MADQKPPRLAGGERETLQALLHYQRDSLVRKVTGLDDQATRQSPVGSGTTLLWLVEHMAAAESTWILQRFGGLEADLAGDAPAPDHTLRDAVAAYRRTWLQVDAVVASATSLDEGCRHPGSGSDPPVNLRWVLTHLLEETARHAGHADIIRELIDGHTGR